MNKTSLPEQRHQEAYHFLQPSRPVLVTTLEEDRSTHAAPFSWVTPLSVDPPLIGLALHAKPRKQHTLENIERHREFAVNVPGLELAEQLVLCSYKVQQGRKKLELAGLTAAPAHQIKPGLIKECRAHLECRVQSIRETGDHMFITGEVVHVSYHPESYTAGLVVNMNQFTPCIHLAHYQSEDGQAHLFFAPGGISLAEVPFVER